MKTRVSGYHIKSYGLDHPQYFPGVGIVGTRWEDVAVGIGATEAEAYEDALESLAQGDWDVSSLPSATDAGMDVEEVVSEDSELYYYVAVYVVGTEKGER